MASRGHARRAAPAARWVRRDGARTWPALTDPPLARPPFPSPLLRRFPLTTESAMKKIEDNNTLVFIVETRANKSQIKAAVRKLYEIQVRAAPAGCHATPASCRAAPARCRASPQSSAACCQTGSRAQRAPAQAEPLPAADCAAPASRSTAPPPRPPRLPAAF